MSSGNEASLRINDLQCRMNPFLKNFSKSDRECGRMHAGERADAIGRMW